MTSADRPPAPTPLPGWLTRPLAAVYAREIGRRTRAYDAGRGVVRLDRPVVSVGNLSTGGTGKTPLVRWVVGRLLDEGARPAVAMRGYGAKPGRPSDEEQEHREAMPGVPIVARPDRAVGLRALFATPEGRAVDCVVLDDGFQHRRLARDLDLVLVDASRPPDRDALLPAGHLREPVSSLARAHGVVITHAELVGADEPARIEGVLRRWLPAGAPVAVAEHAWTALDAAGPGQPGPLDLSWLSGRRVVAACAIGHPDGFLAALKRAGAEVVGALVLGDHDPYGPRTLARLDRLVRDRAPEAVVVTTKDRVKLGAWIASSDVPVVVPRLGVRFRSGASGVAALLGKVSQDARRAAAGRG